MQMNCPHGLMKLPVEVYENICDAPDLCHYEACEYYDTSKEANRRFLKALAYEQTIEGQWKNSERQTQKVTYDLKKIQSALSAGGVKGKKKIKR